MPTLDAVNESGEREASPGTPVPVWAALGRDLREQGIEIEPVPVVGPDGKVLPETREVLATIARHGMLLATGHLGRDEIFAVVDAALEGGAGHRHHPPGVTSQNLAVEDQRALAERGARLERCFTTPHTKKVTWERWTENIRAVGSRHSVLSTDLGQVRNPPVEDGLALMVDRLLHSGFDQDEIHLMAVVNTRRAAGVASP
jgi:alkanesulfonate monooxygenase SsuD/methylene tetrahydromethanopterin reductase-like flavin-dependent oxidoreductase (luciferase family)